MENHIGARKNQETGVQNVGNISLESTIGLRVKVRTLLDEIQTGEIYAYDAVTNTLMLQRESKVPHKSPAAWDFVILKISCLKDIQLEETPETLSSRLGGDSIKDSNAFGRSKVHVKPISLDILPAREQASRKEQQAAIARKGIGVTQEAQNLFDSLSKT
ncbi:hypothetical protein PMAC_003042 [Pneumocystis sp. 'macacae']|nr:hypothetical protein PMAC_003042 [Pneumocystis sp. 'macacae']